MARAPAPVAAEEVAAAAPVAAEEVATETMDEPVVVATILKAADGSFILETGDAPEMIEGEAMAPAGTAFTADEAGIGKLMTAILDLVDPENADGPAAAANFQEGFTGAAKAPPPAA